VVNAIYNATGIRIRDMPATLDKLLPISPDALAHVLIFEKSGHGERH
jgi:hypothetical protein